MCWGPDSHRFPVIGDGHQPSGGVLYIHDEDFLSKVG